MDNFTQINPVKEEPEDDSFTYMNLSDNFHPSPSTTSSYFAKPPPQIKTEVEDNEDGGNVINLDSQPKVKEAKKRGRPKKLKDEGVVDEASPKKTTEKKMKQESLTENLNVKKRRDRFNGMPEEEVLLRLLPDILAPNLDILIIGINPGLFAAYVGHHYAGPGNHFWKCLYLSGLIPEPMNAYDDFKLPSYGIGFTNICPRTTRGSSDLRKSEIKDGGEVLKRKILKYRPKIAVFNGKGIYEVFSAKKEFSIGKQPEIVEGTTTQIFVMPSSSARCAQLPRASDKVPFFLALKKLRDYLKGEVSHLDESEVVFPNIDMRQKPDVKCEKIETECAAELTPEEIIMRAEYLEALEASAEGREIPAERMEKNVKRRIKGGSDDEDLGLTFEDEESSQSSCSSDALRGMHTADGSSLSYSAYCYSKNVAGSSSFEIMTSSQVRDDLPGNCHEDSGSKRVLSPLKTEKDDPKPSGDLRATFSPKPMNHSAAFSPNSRSSPLYTNLGLPPKSSNAPSTNTSTPAGKQYQKASWHHQPSTSHTNNSYSVSSETMTTDHSSRPTQSTPYAPHPNNNNSNQMAMYNNANYCGSSGAGRPPSQPATIPYYPNCGGNDNQQHQIPFGPPGPTQMASPTGTSGQFKGGRPPLHHQWSNGTGGSMPPPTPPHNGTHPFYSRSSHNVGLPSALPQYPPNPSPNTTPFKGAPVGIHPALQQIGMAEKNQKNSGGLNGSFNNVSNYYAS